MTDNAGTPAGESGNNGGAAPLSIDIPTDFEQNDAFKPFFIEADGAKKFDFQALTKSYLDTKQALPVVPETPDAYKFDLPQGWPFDETDAKLFKETAKQHGFTQAQYEAVMKHDLSRMTRAAEELDAEAKKAKQALGGEWKGDFEKNMAMAGRVAQAIFGEGFIKRVDLHNDVDFVKGLYLIATKMGEDTFRSGGAPAGDTRPMGDDGKPRLKFPSMGD